MFNREKANEEREKIGREILDFSPLYSHLLLELSTGVGKSLLSLKIAEKHLSPEGTLLILIKETTHEDNWKKEIEKWGFTFNVEFHCYASLHKLVNSFYEIIILDECHAVGTELKESYLETIKFNKLISLSATVGEDVKQRLHNICPYYQYTVTLDQAIERGILPEPTVYIVYDTLDNTKKDYVYKTKKGEQKCTAREYYNKLNDTIDYWRGRFNTDDSEWIRKRMLFSALNRKKFLAKYKTEKAKKLLGTIGDKRVICFTGSIEQAKKLGGKQAIHSKNSKEENAKIINDFNDLKTSKLFTCQMLTENANLTSTEVGLIIQLDGIDLRIRQKIGRLLRHDFPKIYLLVVKDTKDTSYLRELLENNTFKNIVEIH